ncbi:Alpha/Beta hydrolase protein [Pavlovales sp. CCMP2436]|nr:Alpha/Beta hydrolase protein [Pavlovales sp. CCMP2436]
MPHASRALPLTRLCGISTRGSWVQQLAAARIAGARVGRVRARFSAAAASVPAGSPGHVRERGREAEGAKGADAVSCPVGFDLDHAAEAARLAQLCYVGNPAESTTGLQALGFEQSAVEVVHGQMGTYALVGRRGDAFFVAIRGTFNAENVAADLDMALRPADQFGLRHAPVECAVHRGFGRAYAGLGPKLLRALNGLAKQVPAGADGLSVCVVGHSFGGALAAMLVLQLVAEAQVAEVEAAAVLLAEAAPAAQPAQPAAAGQLSASPSRWGDSAPLPSKGESAPLPETSDDRICVRFTRVEGYTFGLGRVGNEQFAKYFRDTVGTQAQSTQTQGTQAAGGAQAGGAKAAEGAGVGRGASSHAGSSHARSNARSNVRSSTVRGNVSFWSLALLEDPLAHLPPRSLGKKNKRNVKKTELIIKALILLPPLLLPPHPLCKNRNQKHHISEKNIKC